HFFPYTTLFRSTVKYWVRPDIENRIKEGSINAYFNSEVLRITEDAVIIRTPQGELTIENDFVLAMTGYQPPFEFMERCGIQFHDDEYHRSEERRVGKECREQETAEHRNEIEKM